MVFGDGDDGLSVEGGEEKAKDGERGGSMLMFKLLPASVWLDTADIASPFVMPMSTVLFTELPRLIGRHTFIAT